MQQFMMSTIRAILVGVLTVFLVVYPATAKDSSTDVKQRTSSLSFFYQFGPAAGQEEAFFKALRLHSDFRKKQGDPWSWRGYTIVDGPSVGDVIVVSSGHQWADLDAYEASAEKLGLAKDFREHVMPLVRGGKVVSWSSRVFPDMSNWGDDVSASKVMVSVMRIKPAKERAFGDALKKISQALKKGGFKENWLIQRGESGVAGPVYSFVFPGHSWADFDPVSPNAYEVAVKQLGEKKAKELFQTMAESMRSNMSFRAVRLDWLTWEGNP